VYVRRALERGRHVVTANKQLLSRHGEELWALAREQGVHLGFEASVAGVVPVVRVLRESLAGAHIERIHGIVNGTTNFILSEMARTGCSYEEALGQAQQLGYAEADPSDDVSGADAAAKMAILARLAFGAPIHIDDVRYDGIVGITGADIAYARELGLSLKLIGTAERLSGGISVRVHPTFLAAGHPLASVHGSFNAVTVESAAITEITMSGPGAGGSQTASAVLGVLARIAGILGEAGASIKSVVQHGTGERAQLIMVTHPLARSRVSDALAEIGRLEYVRSTPRAISVIDEEFE
jgi:homoserine dehydrogenase